MTLKHHTITLSLLCAAAVTGGAQQQTVICQIIDPLAVQRAAAEAAEARAGRRILLSARAHPNRTSGPKYQAMEDLLITPNGPPYLWIAGQWSRRTYSSSTRSLSPNAI